jgi:hypothetical protein
MPDAALPAVFLSTTRRSPVCRQLGYLFIDDGLIYGPCVLVHVCAVRCRSYV